MLRGIVVFTAFAGLAFATNPYAPHLPEGSGERISTLLRTDPGTLDLEREEIKYQEGVHTQTMADLAEVYKPENLDRVQVAYASFTPERAPKAGEDRGFGFHIVKRLELPLPDGATKTIYINEQWGEDKRSKGLLLPDEIRIKTQVASGERRVPGSEKLYVFDAIRVAWGPYNRDAQIVRRTIYRTVNGKNDFKATRTAVSAPFSCTVCHQPDNKFAAPFLAEGERHNFEAIVQDSQFSLPPERMRGYQQYIAYLESSGTDAATIQGVKNKLANPRTASVVPLLLDVITSHSGKGDVFWLADDSPILERDVEIQNFRQGIYQDYAGRWRVDALQEVADGKYVWWEPLAVIP